MDVRFRHWDLRLATLDPGVEAGAQRRSRLRLCWVLIAGMCSLLSGGSLLASATAVRVDKITVEGNRRTRDQFILRELDFKRGDTISLQELSDRLEFNRLQLMNTGLFIHVGMNIREWETATNQISVDISVLETWYIYPIPIFELADRNFNVWWRDYDHSFRRVNYGVRLYHFNLTGRRDQFKGVVQFGFTDKFEFQYTPPFIDRKQKLGLTTGLLFTRQRELNYGTLDDQQQFYRSEGGHLLQRLRASAGLSFRPHLRIYHQWLLEYHANRISNEVLDELNADFFLGRTHQRFFAFHYEFTVDRRDIRPFPLHGFLTSIGLQKEGFGLFGDVDALYLNGLYKQYLPLDRRWSTEWILGARLGLIRNQQPFYNSRALGYGDDFIRGYEYYVIDGLDFVYLKSSLRWELLNKTYRLGKAMPLKALQRMPVKVYLSFNNDLGYANNPFYAAGNDLPNQLLWGYGLGINFIVYYDKVFNLEVSRNRLGETGFYLHWATKF